MPVRAKKVRRRDSQAELEAWKWYFACGYDFVDALPAIGVETDKYGVPAIDVAREAWCRFGAEFLRTWEGGVSQFGHHAVRVFGAAATEKPGG